MSAQRILALAAGLAAGLAAAPAWSLSLSLSPTTATGSNVSLDLVVAGLASGGPPSLGAYNVQLLFDPNAVAVDTVNFGSFLGPGAFQEALPGTGSVALSEVALVSPGALDALQGDSFVLATVSLSVSGPSAVGFGSVVVGDGFGVALPVTSLTGAAVAPAVPEPMAILAFAAGLAIVVPRLRRGA